MVDRPLQSLLEGNLRLETQQLSDAADVRARVLDVTRPGIDVLGLDISTQQLVDRGDSGL